MNFVGATKLTFTVTGPVTLDAGIVALFDSSKERDTLLPLLML